MAIKESNTDDGLHCCVENWVKVVAEIGRKIIRMRY